MWKRSATVLALVFAACGSGGPERASVAVPTPVAAADASAAPGGPTSGVPGSSAAPVASGAPDAPAATAQAQGAGKAVVASPPGVPRMGAYVYGVTGSYSAGAGEQAMPARDQTEEVTEHAPVESGVEVTTVTRAEGGGADGGGRSASTRSRWEKARVLWLRANVAGADCTFDPSVETHHLPMKVETFPTQTFGGGDCSGSIDIEVVGSEELSAAGRPWKVWKVNVRAVIRTADVRWTSWFAPELGVDVKRDLNATAEYQGVKYNVKTLFVLQDHPKG